MPLSWNEIRNRAHEFSKRWADETSEDAEAKPFWIEFFNVFGIDRKRVASFEEPVKKLGDKQGYIDLFWKGMLLVEHKSRGKDLDKAYTQALDYFPGIKERDLPKYVLVSDFAHFRLYDLEENTETEFKLADLHKRIKHFAFIAGYRTQTIAPQNPVNIKAAERMGKLHDALKAAGYEGHPLEVLLVRLLFCLFAEDTGIFQPASAFRAWIEERTAPDGSDLGPQLAQLFQVLNTPENPPPQSSPASGRGDNRENHSSIPARAKTLDEQLAAFPYINGKLFEEMLPIASFNLTMREALLDCCALDWSSISPAIFGALFQSIMDAKARRNIGAHYTSEENILKLIQPLFLDDLHEEFKRVKGNKNKLFEFHKKLRTLTFFDPACGCGNFLVIAYRELRKLELDVLRAVHEGPGSRFLDIHQEISVDVDQFYGIEIEEFPAQIAQVAMWLMDHQMNVRVSEEFGMYFARIPLKTSPHIVNGNALTLDWNGVLPAERASYVLGNPPFIGHHLQTPKQKSEMLAVYGPDAKAAGVMDYVTAWYCKAARYIQGTLIKVAFVSTNSITQGEQVGILWRALQRSSPLYIHFAHRTFQWSNEAKGKAAVYCVIIGFAAFDVENKTIYEYASPDGEPHGIPAKQINAYLVDAPWVLVENRSNNPFGKPEMMYGSKPTDGGHFLFSDEEKSQFLREEPEAAKFIKPFISAHEYLHNEKRWVLWLVGATSFEINALPKVRERVRTVDAFRKASKAESTRVYPYPTLFRQVTQPKQDYVLIPGHSSENRAFIPFGFFDKNHIVGNSCFALPGATLFHFGVIQSTMHMAWVRYTCGRLESRYRYSKDIVYNNYPWPDEPSDKQRAAIEAAAQAVLDARAQFPQSSLADLYDPLTMPPALVKAHQALDRAVDACYRKAAFTSDAQRVEFLFERYQQLTSLLSSISAKKTRKPKV